MPRWHQRNLALHVQVLGVEPGEVIDWAMHERYVGAPVAEQPGLLADLAQQYVDRYRIRSAGNGLEKPLEQPDGRSGLRCEHQRAFGIAGAARSPRGSRNSIEGDAGLIQQNPSGVGKGHSSTVTFQQPDTEPLLELLYRAGQRWLCDSEPDCGASEVQFLGDGNKIPKFAGLEIGHRARVAFDTWQVSHLTGSVLAFCARSDHRGSHEQHKDRVGNRRE